MKNNIYAEVTVTDKLESKESDPLWRDVMILLSEYIAHRIVYFTLTDRLSLKKEDLGNGSYRYYMDVNVEDINVDTEEDI